MKCSTHTYQKCKTCRIGKMSVTSIRDYIYEKAKNIEDKVLKTPSHADDIVTSNMKKIYWRQIFYSILDSRINYGRQYFI